MSIKREVREGRDGFRVRAKKLIEGKYRYLDKTFATKQEAKERYIHHDEYDNSRMFAPLTRQMPFRSYVRNINDEHVLRNQIFAHQRCESGVYVPGSDSDLYQLKTPTTQVASASDVTPFDTHPLLFKNENYVNAPHYVTDDVGMFHNATRQQIKNVNNK